ncbi:MAG TPA: hypothetical protein VD706_02520 [Candidatus Saccharimonadales bacterium]|nr:hypothetical protein [Candidatus Saccharimonadales bacterium]
MKIGEGELVAFQEQRMLVLPGTELDTVRPGEIVEAEPQPYLGTDVYTGSYGVTSFGLVVPRPLIRPTVYYPGEGPVPNSPHREGEELDPHHQYTDDPLRALHFSATEKGFAVIRTVLAPAAIKAKLQSDRHLGPAIIDKSCLDGTIPEELDEMTELEEPESFHSSSGVVLPEAKDNINLQRKGVVNPYAERVRQRLQEGTDIEYALLREYPSWHSHRAYRPVMEAIALGCQATVANFDEVLSMLAKDMPRIHDFDAAQLGHTSLAKLEPGPAES